MCAKIVVTTFCANFQTTNPVPVTIFSLSRWQDQKAVAVNGQQVNENSHQFSSTSSFASNGGKTYFELVARVSRIVESPSNTSPKHKFSVTDDSATKPLVLEIWYLLRFLLL